MSHHALGLFCFSERFPPRASQTFHIKKWTSWGSITWLTWFLFEMEPWFICLFSVLPLGIWTSLKQRPCFVDVSYVPVQSCCAVVPASGSCLSTSSTLAASTLAHFSVLRYPCFTEHIRDTVSERLSDRRSHALFIWIWIPVPPKPEPSAIFYKESLRSRNGPGSWQSLQTSESSKSSFPSHRWLIHREEISVSESQFLGEVGLELKPETPRS